MHMNAICMCFIPTEGLAEAESYLTNGSDCRASVVPAPPSAGATETLPKPSKPLINSPPVLRPQVEEDEQPGAHLHHLLQPPILQLCSSPISAEST